MPYLRVYSRKYMPGIHCPDALMILTIMEGWQRVDLSPDRSRCSSSCLKQLGCWCLLIAFYVGLWAFRVYPHGFFECSMRKLLHACNGRGPVRTAQMVDDLCLSGSNPREHFENLAELLYHLYACWLKVNKDKCSFYQNSVKFLGKIVDNRGVRLDPSTTDAILNMPEPEDKSQLRSFLGHISYISRHVPDLKSARASLDQLIKPDVQFVWDKIHADSFQKCKLLASNSALLTHFDPKLPWF